MLDWKTLPAMPEVETRLLEEVRMLPQSHQDIEAGVACPAAFAARAVAVLAPVISEARDLPIESLKFVWIGAGMVTAAAERRFRQIGRAPGEAIRALTREAGTPAGDWFLRNSQRAGDVIPRLSHLSYWTWTIANQWAPSFTGSPGELLFRRAVQQHVAAAEASSDAVGLLINGASDLASAGLALTDATALVRRSWAAMAELARAFDHRRAEFATEMRQYLAEFACPHSTGSQGTVGYDTAYAVAEKVWSGPNAANFVRAPLTDHLLGIVDESYLDMIVRRFDYFTVEERKLASATLAAGTAVDWLAARSGVDPVTLVGLTPEGAADVLRTLAPEIIDLVAALTGLAEAWMHWSGVHFGGGVQRHVGQASRYITEDVANSLPVPCSKGASGSELAEVTHVHDLRRRCFLATTMRRAVLMAMPAANESNVKEGAEAK